MIKNYVPSEYREVVTYELVFDDGCNNGFGFPCDVNGKLLKIQVKTSSYVDEKQTAIKFSCRSTHLNCKGVSNVKYSKDEIDYFATYWENKCYLIPVEECGAEKSLRIFPPKNEQSQRIA